MLEIASRLAPWIPDAVAFRPEAQPGLRGLDQRRGSHLGPIDATVQDNARPVTQRAGQYGP